MTTTVDKAVEKTAEKPLEDPKKEEKQGSPNKEARRKYVEKGEGGEKKPGENNEEGRKPRQEREKKEGYGDKEHKKDRPHRERKQRERKEHEEYNYDPTLITLETKIPKIPKKNEQKEKPDEKVYKQKEADVQNKILALIDKRKKIIAEKFEREKKGPVKEGYRTIFDDFYTEKTEVIKIREDFRATLDYINSYKDKIEAAKEDLKKIDEQIKSIDRSKKGDTKENIFERLRRLEHELMTSNLDYKQERYLNAEIEMLRRMTTGAQSAENLEVQLYRLRMERYQKNKEIDELYKEKQVFNDKFNPIKEKLDKQNELVNKIKEECIKRKDERKQFKEGYEKDREEFYYKRSQRIDQVSDYIEKLRDSKDAIWDEYHKKMDEYIEQNNYIRYLEWQTRQQERLIKKKDYYERKKKREEREKEEQARESVQVRKYNNEIQTCDMLLDYCKRLRPAEAKEVEEEKVPYISKEELETQLRGDKNWAKEKGFTVLESKKSKDEDEQRGPKHKKKNKNQDQKKEEKKPTNFSHDLSVMNYFDVVKVMLPLKSYDLDKVISDIQEKKAYYIKASDEEKPAEKPAETPVEGEKKEETPVAA